MRRIFRGVFRPRVWFGLIGLMLFQLARIFGDFRLGGISANRIGHFVGDVCIRQSEQHLGLHSGKFVYGLYPSRPISNTFWLKYACRNGLNVRAFAGPMVEVANHFRTHIKWFLPSPMLINGSKDSANVVSRSGYTFDFTEDEHTQARAWLRSVGWSEEMPIVCLLVRDSEYLATEPGLNPEASGKPAGSWEYHSYRNSDIRTFIPAVEWLVSQGAFVLRMGKAMETAVAVPGMFDYAFSGSRSDFLDVWLFANCSMCVTTGSGPDVISVFSGKQVVAVNHVPLTTVFTYGRVLTASKKLYDINGRRLSLEENIDINLSRTDDFLRKGIVIVELSAGEILDVVKEGWLRSKNTSKTPEYELAAKMRFVKVIENSKVIVESLEIHPDATLSSEWLRVLDNECGELSERTPL